MWTKSSIFQYDFWNFLFNDDVTIGLYYVTLCPNQNIITSIIKSILLKIIESITAL